MDNRELLKVQIEMKNVGIAFALTLFFGGVGLLYTAIKFGLVMIVVEIMIVLICSFFSIGLAKILFIPIHILHAIMAIVLAKRHNAKLFEKFSE